MKNYLGIMQGRLLPKYKGNFQAHPVGYWQDEFKIASELGFDGIEFILDYHKAILNPLFTDQGINKILSEIKKNNIQVRSICADYFMDSPLFEEEPEKKNENINTLKNLFLASKKIGVTDIVIPLVDNSSILHNTRKYKQVVSFFKSFFYQTNIEKVNLCLETDLPPKKFLELVNEINQPQIKINYDTGNSASLGYDFYEEFKTYGHLITNIHIKDRELKGKSVQLGLGDCKFKDILTYLSNVNYKGIFILQAFRGEDGVASLIPQYDYIKKYFEKFFNQ
jgi:sugar phosphate isomerase/epimerase